MTTASSSRIAVWPDSLPELDEALALELAAEQRAEPRAGEAEWMLRAGRRPRARRCRRAPGGSRPARCRRAPAPAGRRGARSNRRTARGWTGVSLSRPCLAIAVLRAPVCPRAGQVRGALACRARATEQGACRAGAAAAAAARSRVSVKSGSCVGTGAVARLGLRRSTRIPLLMGRRCGTRGSGDVTKGRARALPFSCAQGLVVRPAARALCVDACVARSGDSAHSRSGARVDQSREPIFNVPARRRRADRWCCSASFMSCASWCCPTTDDRAAV